MVIGHLRVIRLDLVISGSSDRDHLGGSLAGLRFSPWEFNLISLHHNNRCQKSGKFLFSVSYTLEYLKG